MMARIVRPGGHVVACEQDIGTWVIDHPLRALTDRIAAANVVRYVDGWTGRCLYRLLRDAGLAAVTIQPVTFAETDPDGYLAGLAIRQAQAAADDGAITPQELADWLTSLQTLMDMGAFFSSLNFYSGVGTKAEA